MAQKRHNGNRYVNMKMGVKAMFILFILLFKTGFARYVPLYQNNTAISHFYFSRINHNENAIDSIYLIRENALKNNEKHTLAEADYSLITNIKDPDLAYTKLKILKNDIELYNLDFSGYLCYYQYEIGNIYLDEIGNLNQARNYFFKALNSADDNLNIQNWGLKASIHSKLAEIYLLKKDTLNCWAQFAMAKYLAENTPVLLSNKDNILLDLAKAILPLSVDSTLNILSLIKNNDEDRIFSDEAGLLEAEALVKQKRYVQVINQTAEKLSVSTIGSVPVISDSVDYYTQIQYFSLLTDAYIGLEKQNRFQNYHAIIDQLINNELFCYRRLFEKEITGNEILNEVSKSFDNFISKSLNYLVINKEQNEELILKLIFSSKGMQLSTNITRVESLHTLKNKSTRLTELGKNEQELQRYKSELYQENLSPALKNEIQTKFNNLYFDNLILKHKLNLDSLPAKTFKIPSKAEIRSQLQPRQGLLDLFVGDSSLFLAFLTHDTLLIKKIDHVCVVDSVSKQLYRLKTGLPVKDVNSFILKPFENKIARLSSLVIVPDKALFKIPFETIQLPGKDQLISLLDITYSYSSLLWYHQKNSLKPVKATSILTVAPECFSPNQPMQNPQYNSSVRDSKSLEPLMYSLKEINTIENIASNNNIGCRSLIGNKANETEVRDVINNYSILHFATHGHFDKMNNERSGIYLFQQPVEASNGIQDDNFISISELFNFRLKANLVVLSTCNSNQGKFTGGEGAMTIPRGFIYAGVPNVIASLWKVNDERTRDLMEAFYNHLLNDKVSYAEALHLAKLDCIANGFLPIDWAGFVLIGN